MAILRFQFIKRSIGKARIYVYFECKNLDEQVDKLKQKGLVFDLEPTDQRWLWREARLKARLTIKSLYYAGENRINPPWRIS